MAVPTITTVTPNSGPPTGVHLVEIVGTNFRLPTPPPPTGPAPPVPDSVRVSFGGVVSPRVLVATATRVFAETPKRILVQADGQAIVDPVAVDVLVENIDDLGVLIPTELVTLTDGYSYTRIDLSFDTPSDLSRLEDAVIDLWRSEVLPNTVIGQNTDFDSTTGDGFQFVDIAEVPACILTGPSLAENTFYRRWTDEEENLVSPEFRIVKRPKYNDVSFDILAITNNDRQLVNLVALIDAFLDNNKFIFLDGIPYEMDFVEGSDMDVIKQSNQQLNSNVRTAKGTFLIRAFNMSGFAGVVDHDTKDVGESLTDRVTLEQTEQIGTDLPASHGASRRSPGEC